MENVFQENCIRLLAALHLTISLLSFRISRFRFVFVFFRSPVLASQPPAANQGYKSGDTETTRSVSQSTCFMTFSGLWYAAVTCHDDMPFNMKHQFNSIQFNMYEGTMLFLSSII